MSPEPFFYMTDRPQSILTLSSSWIQHRALYPQDIAYYQALSPERLQTEAARIHPSTLPPQEFYEPGLEPSATAKLDDLQRSWETLKNVVSLWNDWVKSTRHGLPSRLSYATHAESLHTPYAVEYPLLGHRGKNVIWGKKCHNLEDKGLGNI